MLGRIEALFRRWRRRASRSEWLARLLRLPLSSGTETQPGLVLIQIDGLGHGALERALERGDMPFLRRLIAREHYKLHHLYSGIPSTTPAVQGELFYGIRASVPGFNYMSKQSGQLLRMFEPDSAVQVEQRLKGTGAAPLLDGGSCYCDNFTGGATEPHFCPSSLGWGSALRNTNVLVLLFLIISNAYSFVRTAVLLVLEVLLALIDFGRGLIRGHDLWSELKFVPTRVLIVIFLRELITIGVKVDVARGLPIIHLNFLGYDEQSHRRGPRSLFAQWTLKGIDDAIARIWRASHRSERRSYDVWIYSDHGQRQVEPYEKRHGSSFGEAATGVFSDYLATPVLLRASGRTGIQLQRIRMLGGERTQRFFAHFLARITNGQYSPAAPSVAELTVAPLGPVAHLYYSKPLSARELSDLALRMVAQANVPLILHKDADGLVRATNRSGEFSLVDDPAAALGDQHPYLEAVCNDLIAMCEHPDAGTLVALGHSPGLQALSFAMENGAHGGPSVEETSAFALAPGDIVLESTSAGHGRPLRRPLDLRRAALTFLHRPADDLKAGTIHSRPPQRHRRVG